MQGPLGNAYMGVANAGWARNERESRGRKASNMTATCALLKQNVVRMLEKRQNAAKLKWCEPL
jgi:hypothetical protein